MVRMVNVCVLFFALCCVTSAYEPEDEDDLHEEAAFTHAELDAAFQDTSQPLPAHMLKPASLVEVEEAAESNEHIYGRRRGKKEDENGEMQDIDPEDEPPKKKGGGWYGRRRKNEDEEGGEYDDDQEPQEEKQKGGWFRRRKNDGPFEAPQLNTHETGQVLRGTLNIQGYHFAIRMDRMAFTKKKYNNWFQRKKDKHKDSWFGSTKYWLASGEMWFKLLRFPTEEPEKDAIGRKNIAKKYKDTGAMADGDISSVLHQGWVGRVKLNGWWNDASSHFRGETMDHKNVSDLSWMHNAMLPWKDLDMRFDNEGVHCRADFKNEQRWLVTKIFSLGLAKDHTHYVIFRLDSLNDKGPSKRNAKSVLPPKEDATRVYQGMWESQSGGLANDITYSTTMRLDDCFKEADAQDQADFFQCPLEMRPIALDNLAKADNQSNASKTTGIFFKKDKVTISTRYQQKAGLGGPWFTYMGMKGKVNLRFDENGNGDYDANPMSSSCWGENPCPFIDPKQHFKAQFLDEVIMLEPKQGETMFLYPIFNDELMHDNPVGTNMQAITSHVKSIPPIRENEEDDDSGDNMHSEGSSGSEEGQRQMRELEAKLDEKNVKIAKLKEGLRMCGSAGEEQISDDFSASMPGKSKLPDLSEGGSDNSWQSF